jgi:WD40 repeat protein
MARICLGNLDWRLDFGAVVLVVAIIIGVAIVPLFDPPSASAQSKPGLVLQTGHSGGVRSVAFSPDGRLLASGSLDTSIRIWDVASGLLLRSLNGRKGFVTAVAFSPDGRLLASAGRHVFDKGRQGVVTLWEVATGREVRTLLTTGDSVKSMNFSPDGSLLALAGSVVTIWDLKASRRLTPPDKMPLNDAAAFNHDGKLLAAASQGNAVIIWEVASWRKLLVLNGHTERVNALAFSPDGATLVSGGNDKVVRVWEVATGRRVRPLAAHTSAVTSLAFSADGRLIASGAEADDSTVTIWDSATGRELRVIAKHTSSIESVAFSPKEPLLASASDDGTVKLWNPNTGSEVRKLAGQISRPDMYNTISFTADGRIMASGAGHLWDLSTGTQAAVLGNQLSDVSAVVCSSDGRTVASTQRGDNTVRLWDTATAREKHKMSGHTESVFSLAMAPDGRTVASASADKTVKLWDVNTGNLLYTFAGHSDWVFAVAFSPDGRLLATAGKDKTIKLWDLATRKAVRTFSGHTSWILALAFSPDGAMLASGSGDLLSGIPAAERLEIGLTLKTDFFTSTGDPIVKLWDTSTGRELRAFKGHTGLVSAVAFSPDGRMLASGSYDQTVRVWDVAEGRELRTQTGHTDAVNAVSFSPNGRFIVSASVDGSTRICESRSGELMALLLSLQESSDWLVVSPEGLFDGSPAAWNQILWRFSENTLDVSPVEAFFNEFYYPGLLGEIVAGKRIRIASDVSQKDRRQAKLSLESAEAQSASVSTRMLKIKVNVTEAPAGAQDVRLFRNGSLVKLWRGDVLKGQDAVTLETTISITVGENRLSAYAFNRDNVKSTDATLMINGSDSLKRVAKLHLVAIGINQYANAGYNLKYAVSDARAFSDELERQQKKLGSYGAIQITTLFDRDATKANLLYALARLAGARDAKAPSGAPALLENIKAAEPEDAVILFYAGHGTAQDQRFYLIPHDLGYFGTRNQLDESGLKRILSHSVSDLEIEQACEGIDAGHLLMVIDACNSGQALEAEEKRRGPMNSKGLAQLAYEKGMYILTAAQSYQAAMEAEQLGHGYLTYALVEEGLKSGAADIQPKDNQVMLREWLDYATERVPRMQESKMREGRGLKHSVAFVEGEETIEDIDKRSVQRPRVFYRREFETRPMVVARP